MASPIWLSSLKPQIEGGVRGKAATTHSDHWHIQAGNVATWFGIPVPTGVSDVFQEVNMTMNSWDPVWYCAWIKDGQKGHISMSTEVPPQERITAALVAMRMQHGNDSEVEGGSTP